MDKETKTMSVVILAIIGILYYGVWWMEVGSSRSEYNYCLGEYMRVNGKPVNTYWDAIHEMDAFKYCFDKIY